METPILAPPRSGPVIVHVREIDAKRLGVDVVTSEGNVSVTILKPSDSAVGTAVVNGKQVCLPGSLDCQDSATDLKSGQVGPQIAVAPIVLWVIRVYATWDFIRGCARPLWSDLRSAGISGITQTTLDNCVLAGASEAAGGVLGAYLRGVGVTRLRTAIKDSVGVRITWQQLRGALNRRNFRDVVEIAAALAEEFFQRVYDGIYQAIRRL
jgi:hypothetical protein